MTKNQNTQSSNHSGGGHGMGMGMGGGAKAKNFKASMKKLIAYIKPYKISVLTAVIFTVTATVLSIIAPSFVGEISQLIAVSAWGLPIEIDKVTNFAIILAIFYALNALLSYVQAYLMAGVTQKVTRSLRTDISEKINVIPLKYFDSNNIGNTLSRVTNDVDTIGQTLNQSFSTLISSIIMLVGVLIAMFVTNWQLAVTAILTVPISFMLMMVIIKISQKYFKAQQKSLGALNGHIEEIYTGQNIVKAFNGEKKALTKFEKINNELESSAKKSQFLSGLMMPLMNFISNFGYIAIAVVGGVLFVNNQVQIGAIATFFIYVRLFQNPLSQIAQAAGNLQSTAAASERVFEFLDEKEQANEDDQTNFLENVKGMVEFKDVKFGYDESRLIIKGFSAKVNPGQKVAIVGPTGAGKTTMINLLMRFYELNQGEILIDGVPISSMKRAHVRSLFGMVLQDTWLFEGTIRENIVYATKNVTDDAVYEAAKAANVDHFIRTQVGGYDMILNDDASVSGGQRQLLTIARAMVQNSPMLILDEATSNVDTRTEKLIQEAMDTITKGRTSFVIAHRLSTIKNADLIIVMNEGDIVETGTHDELIVKDGFYSDLYNSQFSNDEVVE